jgi:Protein of unknown function DUF262
MPIPVPLLNGTTRAYSIGRLFEMGPTEPISLGERRMLGLVLPAWQRPEVWTVLQKTRFIEGIFHGFGTGYYVTNGLDWQDDGSRKPMAGWLLDGQQRISALRDFVQNELTIFDDVQYSSLSEPERRRFLRKHFDCFELEYSNDEDRLMALYDRMNFGGTPHDVQQRAIKAPLYPSARC